MRRGRGASEGRSDEPISCNHGTNFSAMDNAVADTDAALAYARTLPFIDASRVVLSGSSRGGILSVYYAEQRPGVAKGVVNFVGGWTGDGCSGDFNGTLYRKAAAAKLPTLWLYTENDSYYSAQSIRHYAKLYEESGGKIALRLYPPVGKDGHYLSRYPDVWRRDVDGFLDGLGFAPAP
jgi:dienelactone hydrolase